MATHTVSHGESIASIAKNQGFLWKTIWEHPNNAGLRTKRKDPNQLVAGDELFIPEKGNKSVSRPVDARHTFTRKGEPTRLRLRMTTQDDARANEAYTLTFGTQVIHGVTDDDGKIDHPIPGETQSARLTMSEGQEVYDVEIGGLPPANENQGIQSRLENLGFDCGGERGQIGEGTRRAIKRFQAQQGLQISGEVDAATQNKLEALHV